MFYYRIREKLFLCDLYNSLQVHTIALPNLTIMKNIQQASLGKRSSLRYVITIALLFLLVIVVGQLAYQVGMSLIGVSSAELGNYTLQQARDLMGKNLFFIVNLFPFATKFQSF
jgi:hypothetical protein